MSGHDKLDTNQLSTTDVREMSSDVTRYKTNTVGPHQREMWYTDGSDFLANQQKLLVSFLHVPSGKAIFFKAFIVAFNEQYTSNWASEEVYGRNDPIHLFKNTSRKITLGLKVPAASESEAYENLGKIQRLTQFLYPNYTDVGSATTIAQSPLVRIKVMNLMQKSPPSPDLDAIESQAYQDAVAAQPRVGATFAGPGGAVGTIVGPGPVPESEKARLAAEASERGTAKGLYKMYKSNPASSEGLLGVIENLAVNHNLETTEGAFVIQENTILPKLINIDLSFSVMHEEPLGWRESTGGKSEFESSTFPYGVMLESEPASTNDVAPITVIIPPAAEPAIGDRDDTAVGALAIAEVLTVTRALAPTAAEESLAGTFLKEDAPVPEGYRLVDVSALGAIDLAGGGYAGASAGERWGKLEFDLDPYDE
jgi:hypothetical protein